MNHQFNRHGATVRLVLSMLCAVMFIPALMTVGWVFSLRETKAQAAAESAHAVAERARVNSQSAQADVSSATRAFNRVAESTAPSLSPTPDHRFQPSSTGAPLRPVTETSYQNESRTVVRPITDPETGETRIVHETVQVRVPVTTTRYIHVPQTTHGRQVMRLVEQLQQMDRNDEDREAKIDELKTRLAAEFQQLHKQQGLEIARTQERLESLKKTHEQREGRRDEIVQRRVSELIGRPDILDWNPSENSFSHRIDAVPGQPMQSPRVSSGQVTPGNLTLPEPQSFVAPSSQYPRQEIDEIEIDIVSPPAAPGSAPAVPAPPAPPAPSPGGRYDPTPPLTPDDSRRAQTPLSPPRAFQPNTEVEVHEFRSEVESDATHELPGRFGQTRSINVSSGASNEVFELARRLSADMLAESAARAEHEQTKRLLGSRAIPNSQLQQHASQLEQAVRQAALARFQWEALSKRLERDLQYAERRFELTQQLASEARSRYENGITPGKEVLEAEGALEQARKSLDDLRDKLEQLGAAEKLFGDSSDSDASVAREVDSDVEVEVVVEEEGESDEELEIEADTDSSES